MKYFKRVNEGRPMVTLCDMPLLNLSANPSFINSLALKFILFWNEVL